MPPDVTTTQTGTQRSSPGLPTAKRSATTVLSGELAMESQNGYETCSSESAMAESKRCKAVQSSALPISLHQEHSLVQGKLYYLVLTPLSKLY